MYAAVRSVGTYMMLHLGPYGRECFLVPYTHMFQDQVRIAWRRLPWHANGCIGLG